MKYFNLYYPMSETIREKYDRSNYWALEELWECFSGTEFTANLYWVNLNGLGRERHASYRSKAFNLLMQDMVNPESSLRKNYYQGYSQKFASEASERLTEEEKQKAGLLERELWIICCEELIRKMAEYAPSVEEDDAYLLEGHTDRFHFPFYLPEAIPPKVFSEMDCKMFTDPTFPDKDCFKLSELGAENVFEYAVVPFYYRLAKFHKDPENPEKRNLAEYYVGLK